MPEPVADTLVILDRIGRSPECGRPRGRWGFQPPSAPVARVVRAMIGALPEPERSRRQLALTVSGVLPIPADAPDELLAAIAAATTSGPCGDGRSARIPLRIWLQAAPEPSSTPVLEALADDAPTEHDYACHDLVTAIAFRRYREHVRGRRAGSAARAVDTDGEFQSAAWAARCVAIAADPDVFSDVEVAATLEAHLEIGCETLRAWILHALPVDRIARLGLSAQCKYTDRRLGAFGEIAWSLDPARRSAFGAAVGALRKQVQPDAWPSELVTLFAATQPAIFEAIAKAEDPLAIDDVDDIARKFGVAPSPEEQAAIDAATKLASAQSVDDGGDDEGPEAAELHRRIARMTGAYVAPTQHASAEQLHALSIVERRTVLMSAEDHPGATIDLAAVAQAAGIDPACIREVLADRGVRWRYDVPPDAVMEAKQLDTASLFRAVGGTRDTQTKLELAEALTHEEHELDDMDIAITEPAHARAIAAVTTIGNVGRCFATVVSAIDSEAAMREWCAAAASWASRQDVPLKAWASAVETIESLHRGELVRVVREPPARDFLLALGRRALLDPPDRASMHIAARMLRELVRSSLRLLPIEIRLAEEMAAVVVRDPTVAWCAQELREDLLEAFADGADVRAALEALPRRPGRLGQPTWAEHEAGKTRRARRRRLGPSLRSP